MKKLNFLDVHEAYLSVLAAVYDEPEFISAPRGLLTKECLNYSFTIAQPKVEHIKTNSESRNSIIKAYSIKEFDLYESGSRMASDYAKASKFWNTIANPDGTINSAYGNLIWRNKSHGSHFEGVKRTPWEWCKQALTADQYTRQAILRFSLPEHQWVGNKDQTCTLHGLFVIRDGYLNLTITMRSNDVVRGLVYDLPWFVSLIHKMRLELLHLYPELKIGTYTHFVHSLHLYDTDSDKVLQMLGRSV